jgi:GNAT superfamily N-acetyltransferase
MTSVRWCREGESGKILAVINAAAQAYRGVIAADLWHEPYMAAAELDRDIAAGVRFCGYETGAGLVGVMGIQRTHDVDLIRHAYVLPSSQRCGVGSALLEQLQRLGNRRLLVGTWAAAEWAIRFYRRYGFELVPPERANVLLDAYWNIPARQVETSVVLASPPLK